MRLPLVNLYKLREKPKGLTTFSSRFQSDQWCIKISEIDFRLKCISCHLAQHAHKHISINFTTENSLWTKLFGDKLVG